MWLVLVACMGDGSVGDRGGRLPDGDPLVLSKGIEVLDGHCPRLGLHITQVYIKEKAPWIDMLI
jgi:hypothetical protein